MDMASTALMTTSSLADIQDFALGDAFVCPATRTIRGPGGSAQVEPRVMQVLVLLAHASGAVVTRDKLLARCWGGVYVGDDSLNRAIAGVRRIGSRIANGSFEVETIPRTGYRLIAHATAGALPLQTAGASMPTQVGEASAIPLARGISRRWLLGGGLAAAAELAMWTVRTAAPDDVERLMDDSRVAMRAGTGAKAREAIGLLRKAVAISPQNADAWALLALTLARADEHAIDTTISPARDVTKLQAVRCNWIAAMLMPARP